MFKHVSSQALGSYAPCWWMFLKTNHPPFHFHFIYILQLLCFNMLLMDLPSIYRIDLFLTFSLNIGNEFKLWGKRALAYCSIIFIVVHVHINRTYVACIVMGNCKLLKKKLSLTPTRLDFGLKSVKFAYFYKIFLYLWVYSKQGRK